MTKKTTLVFVAATAVLVLLTGGAILALGPAPYPTGPVTFEVYDFEEGTIQPGEKTRYEFSWNGIRAAVVEARVQADPAREGWICVDAEGEIVGAPSLLYRGNDSVHSCMRSDTLKPDLYSIRIRESLDYYDMSVSFDHECGVAKKEKQTLTRSSEKTFEFSNAFGPVSAFALVRSLPWETGTERSFEVIDGNDRYLLVVRAEEEETITVPAGTFRSIRLQPSIFEMPSQKGRETAAYWEKREKKDQERISLMKSFSLWMGKEPPRPLVKIRTDVYFGHIDMELAEFSVP